MYISHTESSHDSGGADFYELLKCEERNDINITRDMTSKAFVRAI